MHYHCAIQANCILQESNLSTSVSETDCHSSGTKILNASYRDRTYQYSLTRVNEYRGLNPASSPAESRCLNKSPNGELNSGLLITPYENTSEMHYHYAIQAWCILQGSNLSTSVFETDCHASGTKILKVKCILQGSNLSIPGIKSGLVTS